MLVTYQNKSFRKFVIWPTGAVCAVKSKQPKHIGKAKAGALLPYASMFDKLLIKAPHNRFTMKARLKYFLLVFGISFLCQKIAAQAPSISYSPSINVYNIGTPISTLTPVNPGGSVPATTFGTVTTLAGTTTNIDNPRGLASDGAGNIYEADFTGNVIYKIPSSGAPVIFAGTGAALELDGNGTAAKFNGPSGIVYDGTGNLYVADNGGNTIRKISLTSPYAVTTIAGTGAAAEASGNGNVAKFNKPYGITYDGSTYLYVTDNAGNTIRRVAVASPFAVTTIAGTGTAGETNNTTGTSAKFNGPAGIVYNSPNLYITDEAGNTIREVSTTSPYAATTFAGSGTAGSANGTGTAATFRAPYGIDVDPSGNLLIADEGNNLVRTITSGAVVTTLAGSGTKADVDGVTTAAEFFSPYAIAADNAGNAFTGDNNGASSTVRKILLTGYTISAAPPTGISFDITTGKFSGTPTVLSSAAVYTVVAYNSLGSSSTTVTISCVYAAPTISYSPATNSYLVGSAISTLAPTTSGTIGSFSYGSGTQIGGTLAGADAVAFDASGNIYISGYSAGKIYEYSSAGVYIGTFGTGVTMSEPSSIVFDSSGNCYVLDTNNKCIYKFNSAGVYQSTILSGLNLAYGIDIDASNFIYVADDGANTVKKYNTSGALQLSLPTTNLSAPSGVAVDQSGNIYVLNYTSGKVGKYSSAGTLINASFIAGLTNPWVITVDGGGNIYIGDSGASTVRVYNSSGTALTTITGPAIAAPDGMAPDANGNLYVSDYTNNTLYKYPLAGGYYVSPALPPGLSFDNTTGDFTGTPTASWPKTAYTVSTFNASASGSTTVYITCYKQFIWVGTSSTVWTATGNWSGGVVPSSADQALIGASNPFVNLPVITANTSIGSVIMGTASGTAPGITVNSGVTFTASGDITYQSDNQAYRNLTATLSGSGSISAADINVIANTTLTGHPYTEALSSSVNTLSLSGNVALTSEKISADAFNSTFSVTGGATSVAGIFQTTNTAGSTSTISVSNGTLQLANPTALSGLSALGTNTVTFNGTGATVEYSGTAAQTVYTTASITGLSAGVSYTNIAFSGSGIKTATSGNLNISGNFTNTLANDATDYVALGTPAVNFNGITQTLAGGSGSGTKFYTVNFSGGGTKTLSTGSFYLASAGLLTMSGSSTLAAGGLLTLNSDTTGTATVAQIPSGSSISGNVTVQRFVQGGSTYSAGRWVSRNYRLLSSPVNEGVDGNGHYPSQLNYLGASTIITDCTSTYGTTSGNPSLYFYDEGYTPSSTSFTGGNFIGVTNISNTLATGHVTTTDATNPSAKVYVGGGYMLYFRGDKVTHISGSPSKTSYPYVAPESVTFSTTGNLNQGAYSVVSWTGYAGLLYTTSNSGNAPVRGFNLVGNPYASSIDWSTFSNTTSSAPIYGASVNPTIYILNPTTGNYDTYNAVTGIATGKASNVIPSGQGFFVQSNGHSSSLTFNETAKVSTQVTGSNLLMTAPGARAALAGGGYNSFMRLNLVTNSIYQNDMVIGFNASSTANFNGREDSEFLSGMGALQSISAISADSVKASVKWLPFPKNTANLVVKLNLNAAASGAYTLQRTDLKEIPAIYQVWLMDHYKKDSLDIKNNMNYVFDINLADTASFGSNRFTLVVRQNPALGVHLLDFTALKVVNGSQIVWKTENEQNYTNFAVERSTDEGKTYEIIYGLASSSEGAYSFLDKNPADGANMYKLQITDLNGNITFSNVVTIMYGRVNSLVKTGIVVYPNPAKTSLNLDISPGFNSNSIGGEISSSAYRVQISNILGSVIKQTTINQANWQTDVSALMPGTYVIQVVNKNDNSIVGQSTFIKL